MPRSTVVAPLSSGNARRRTQARFAGTGTDPPLSPMTKFTAKLRVCRRKYKETRDIAGQLSAADPRFDKTQKRLKKRQRRMDTLVVEIDAIQAAKSARYREQEKCREKKLNGGGPLARSRSC